MPRAPVIGPPLEHAALDEVIEPLGEHLAGDAQIRLHLIEASESYVDIAQDQRRPRLPDDVECARYRARHLAEVRALHDGEFTTRGSLKELTLLRSWGLLTEPWKGVPT